MVNTRANGHGNNNHNQGNQNQENNNNNGPDPIPMDPVQMMAMQAQVLQNLAQVVANLQQVQQPPQVPRPQNGLREFLSTQPPTFSHAVEPLEADDWLRTIENKLQISQCAEH